MRSHAKALVGALILLGSLVLGVTLASGIPPSVAIDPPTAATFNSAHVSGTVNPEDNETRYAFEYAIDPDTEGWSSTDFFSSEPIPAGAGPSAVQADLSGLKPGSTYRVRLLANNFVDPEALSSEETFTTDAVNPPEVSGLLISAITATTAHFEATVNSGGSGPGEASEYRFSCSPECPGIEDFQPATSDGANHTVQADATGLEPNTPYTVTVTARNAGGEDEETAEPLPSFETDPAGPEAITYAVHGYPTDTSAPVAGSVNPRNSPTDYWFEYATQADFSDAQSAPASKDADAGSGSEAKLFGQDLSGLEPNITYHYRVVADNGVGGTVAGAARTLRTAPTPQPEAECPNEAVRQQQHSTYLPDCRAYERVGPQDKNNQGITLAGVSRDGNRAFTLILGGASDHGTQTVLASRVATGWSHNKMLPPAEQILQGGVYGLAAWTPSLSHFVASASNGVLGGGPESLALLDGRGGQTLLANLPNTDSRGSSVEISDDGSGVFLASWAPFDPGHVPDTPNVYDFATDPPELISRLPDGSVPTCGSASRSAPGFAGGSLESTPWQHWASADGSRVFFLSGSQPDCSGAQLYLRNRATQTTTLISAPALTGEAFFLQANAAGTQVVYATAASLVGEDTNGNPDVYRWSEGSGNACLTCVVPDADVNPGNNGVYTDSVGVSEDLSHVYFISRRQLIPGQGVEGAKNLYLWHEGEIDYLSPAFSVGSNPVPAIGSALTPDGQTLVFRAGGGDGETATLDALTGQDNGGFTQFYRYDDRTATLTCISCPANGEPPTKPADTLAVKEVRVISDDGAVVVFSTPSPLDPRDTNERGDLYQWRDGRPSLIGDGVSRAPASGGPFSGGLDDHLVGVSASGADVFFTSYTRFTSGTSDLGNQLFDARSGGGFAEPPPPPTPCQGEGCLGAPSARPPETPASSAQFSGPPDPKAKRRKHRHHKKHRQHKKQRQHKRAANQNRGGAK